MPDQSAAAIVGIAPVPAARLEPDAIGAAQDTVIGMASAAPAVSTGLTLAALAAASAYAGGLVIVLTALPMLIIANSYRRLNLWNANCGASFEWVGRAINPYLGFMTGWLMVIGSIIGTLGPVVVLGPSVLAVFGAPSTATWPNVVIGTTVVLVMLIIAVAGIRLTARTQVALGLVEYAILIGFAVAGLLLVLRHHPGTYPVTRDWFALRGIGGRGSLAAGFLVAVFAFTGWDGTIYVNEEVKHRRENPGRAAIMAVAFLAVLFVLCQISLQGAVLPAQLQANAPSALVYTATAIGGGTWAKVMALALALSVTASTNCGIVLTARMIYGMASHRVLPPFLANVSRRFATPVAASVAVGVVLIAVTWLYLLTTSVAGAFDNVIAVTGLLYATFYILTAMAAIAYYRRRIFSGAWNAITLGILPVAAAGFLGWVLVQSLRTAPPLQIWSLAGIVAGGAILMLCARLILRAPFFQLRRETEPRNQEP